VLLWQLPYHSNSDDIQSCWLSSPIVSEPKRCGFRWPGSDYGLFALIGGFTRTVVLISYGNRTNRVTAAAVTSLSKFANQQLMYWVGWALFNNGGSGGHSTNWLIRSSQQLVCDRTVWHSRRFLQLVLALFISRLHGCRQRHVVKFGAVFPKPWDARLAAQTCNQSEWGVILSEC